MERFGYFGVSHIGSFEPLSLFGTLLSFKNEGAKLSISKLYLSLSNIFFFRLGWFVMECGHK